ncbi:MAG: hypothetical protein WKF84_22405 [Pyrinomonadaceae bacterium]
MQKVRQGIIQLRLATNLDYRSYDAAWRLAKFAYYLGAHASDAAERDQSFRDGMKAGKLAIKLREDQPRRPLLAGRQLRRKRAKRRAGGPRGDQRSSSGDGDRPASG